MFFFLRFPNCYTSQNCHWPVNDKFSAIPQLLYELKLSLTSQWHFLRALFETVIDRSMTNFLQFPNCYTSQNCHWLVNDTRLEPYLRVSVTSQWHFFCDSPTIRSKLSLTLFIFAVSDSNQSTAVFSTFCLSAQSWHLNFPWWFDCLDPENHIFSECTSPQSPGSPRSHGPPGPHGQPCPPGKP